MKRSLMIVAVAVVALVLGLAINLSSAAPKELPAPARVAVVDIGRIFRNYDKAKDFAAKQKAAMEEIEKKDRQYKKDIEDLNNQLGGGPTSLKPGTPDYDKVTEDLTKKMIERQAWANTQTEMQNRTNLRLSKEMHDEIVAMIGHVAKDDGYTLVLVKESAELSTRTVDEFLDQLTRRKVLYADPSMEITDQVLLNLNELYKGQKK